MSKKYGKRIPTCIIILLGLFIFFSPLFKSSKNLQKNITNIPEKVSHSKKYFGVNIAGPEFQQPIYADSNYKGYQYFASKGLTLIRIPVKWELVQPAAKGNLDNAQLQSYTNMVVSARNAGENVIIDVHNYGRYNNNRLASSDIDIFSDLWTKIAQRFSDNKAIFGYELMNEPHDLPGGCQTWANLSQLAINAIRKVDASHYILVPGYSWQSAPDWQENSDCLKNLQDPSNMLIYSAHEYFDEDKSGTYTSLCMNINIGAIRAKPFLDWLATNKKIGMFTEYGIPQNLCWQQTLDAFLQNIYSNPNIIGGIYWAAGPAWGNYPLSIEPHNNTDKPQMRIVEKYPTLK